MQGKKTVDIGILVTSRNEEVEQDEPVQMKIYQSNSYRKELSWLHFEDEPRVQKSQ